MHHLFKAIACSCLLLGAVPLAHAQNDGTPRTLSPRTLTPGGQNDPVPNVTPVPVKTISSGINVQSLDSVSSEALGVLSGKDAFPSDMWFGVDRPIVEHLINTLPPTPASPYLRILQRRLLLSAAQPPMGQSGEKSLLAIRAGKLAEMGQTTDVISLIRSAPQNERGNDLDRLEAEALLLENKTTQACSLAASKIQGNTDTFWVKIMAFCRILAKQNDQALLSLSLLKDLGDTDPVFYNLMDALAAGETAKIENLPAPNALDIALISANQADLSDDVQSTQNPNLLGLLVKAKKIGAIEKAAQLHLVNIQSLRSAYLSVKFDKKSLADPISAAESLDPMQAQALLYQVSAEEGQLSVIRTETMGLALDIAQPAGTFFTIARLYQPMIAGLDRGIDHLWFAPKAVRALLAAGDWDNAKAWYLMLRNAAFSDKEAEKAWTLIRPLAALAGFDISVDSVSQALNNWWKAQEATPQSFQKAALIYSLNDGLGLNVPDHLWLKLMDGPKLKAGISPKPGTWIKMNKAALLGRVGETVLMALHGLNQSSAPDLNTTFLRDSLFGLRNVGLERDARVVAVETALLAGF